MTSSRPRPRPVLRSPGAQAAALLALLALDVGPALAQRGAIPAGAQTRLQEIRITASEGRLIRLPRPAGSIFLADPTIADLQTPNAASVFVFGKKPGRTTLYALDGAGVQIAAWRIIIAYSDAELRELLRAEVGNYPVSLAYTPNGGVLSGTVPTPQAAERVRAVAARFVGDGGVLATGVDAESTAEVPPIVQPIGTGTEDAAENRPLYPSDITEEVKNAVLANVEKCLTLLLTDAESPVVEVQGLFTVPLEELRAVNGAVLPSRFA